MSKRKNMTWWRNRDWLTAWVTVAAWALITCSTVTAETGPVFAKDILPLVNTYCIKCHSDKKAKGDVNLETFKDEAAIRHAPKTWETVCRQLADRTMPPQDKPQPTSEDREKMIQWVRHMLDTLDDSNMPKDPGRVVIHRLSRLEYNNTIRDLFGVDTKPADKFPTDGGGGGGFDNNADTLFVPPILMEKLLGAATEILDQTKPERLFLFQPGPKLTKHNAARKVVEHFGTRIFRRPLEKAEAERYLTVFDAADKSGDTYEEAVKQSLKAMLISPNFVFRVEAERNLTTAYQISDYELASRLSYFLWSSMPDEELFSLAQLKRLHEPKVIEAEVHRMLLDPKAKAFAENFMTQWLGVKTLKTTTQPDLRRFPNYTISLRDAMYTEPVEFFRSLMLENTSILQLLDADYTFLNEELAKHYGISGVQGPDFRRVKLTDRSRGGVLSMGGVLTLTSYPQRTSPVLRGKWVLEEILGAPVPPPPPNVGGLPANDAPKDGLSFRQRLEEHRKKPECSSCHNRMDPIGFGMENFDAVGRWRTDIAKQPVDSSGVMTDGKKFQGPAELKQILLGRKDEFVRNLSERMLAYAMGRGLEYYDIPTVRKITTTLSKEDYRLSTLIIEIVKSYPFQYRRPSA